MQMKWFSWFGVEACATELFQWTQRVQKGALFWSPNGTSKKGSFYPISVGSEIGSKVEVLMVFKIYRYQIWLWFSWCGVKACATESVKN